MLLRFFYSTIINYCNLAYLRHQHNLLLRYAMCNGITCDYAITLTFAIFSSDATALHALANHTLQVLQTQSRIACEIH